MSVLALIDPNVRALLKQHPLLKGTNIIGRGAFCCVFEGKKKTRVYKLTTDSTHAAYLTDADAPQGLYKPKVFANHHVVGETSTGLDLFLLEVERLRPIRKGSANWDLAEALIQYDRDHGRLPQSKRSARWATDELLCFMRQLNQFTRIFGCRLDLSKANFMERNNGHLVFSDPVFDEESRERNSYSMRNVPRSRLRQALASYL